MANLLNNPSFETGAGTVTISGYVNGSANVLYWSGDGVSCGFATDQKHAGSQSAKIVGIVSGDNWHSCQYYAPADYALSVAISPNTVYYFSGWLKANGFTVSASAPGIYIFEKDSAGNYIAGTDVQLGLASGTEDWTKKIRQWTTKANAAYISIAFIRAHGHGGEIWADDFYLSTEPETAIKKVARTLMGVGV